MADPISDTLERRLRRVPSFAIESIWASSPDIGAGRASATGRLQPARGLQPARPAGRSPGTPRGQRGGTAGRPATTAGSDGRRPSCGPVPERVGMDAEQRGRLSQWQRGRRWRRGLHDRLARTTGNAPTVRRMECGTTGRTPHMGVEYPVLARCASRLRDRHWARPGHPGDDDGRDDGRDADDDDAHEHEERLADEPGSLAVGPRVAGIDERAGAAPGSPTDRPWPRSPTDRRRCGASRPTLGLRASRQRRQHEPSAITAISDQRCPSTEAAADDGRGSHAGHERHDRTGRGDRGHDEQGPSRRGRSCGSPRRAPASPRRARAA